MLNIGLFEEVDVRAAKVVVDRLIEVGGVLAWDGIAGVVAHKALLVEDGAEATDEGEHPGPKESFSIQVGIAHVEDATPVVDVGIESILQAVTAEARNDGTKVGYRSVGWQFVVVRGGVGSNTSHHDQHHCYTRHHRYTSAVHPR